MARLSFPLGFQIVDNAGSANTGQSIDERFVFPSFTDRNNYVENFLYEGLLSYTAGSAYHNSGITSNAGFYYRNSANAWTGLNADTIDDKHAFGTMLSSTNSYTNPINGSNIVDHINYLYYLTSALSTTRAWKDPVATFADLASTYPSPEEGWAAAVQADNHIYVYNGIAWVDTGGNAPMLSDSVDGIVSSTWYDDLYDFVTNTSNYTNLNSLQNLAIQNGGSGILGSPIEATTVDDTFTFNFTGNASASVSGKVITVNVSDSSISANDSELIYKDPSDSTVKGASNLLYDNIRLKFNASPLNQYSNINIGHFTPGNVGSNSLYLGNVSGYNIQYGVNNVFIGPTAGHNVPGGTNRNFIVSTGSYSISGEAPSEVYEQRLIDAQFPITNASDNYGLFKLRAKLFVKELDTFLDRSFINGTSNLIFRDTTVNREVTLSELVNNQVNITGAASTVVANNLTSNRVVTSNSSGKLTDSTTTVTELGYLNGTTSSIQTQLNSKQPLNQMLTGISSLTSTLGIITQIGSSSFIQRSIVSGNGISLINGNGSSGNPTISVNESQLLLTNIGGTLPISKGGTGQTTANAALNALLPAQNANNNKFLMTNGTNSSWQAISGLSMLFQVPNGFSQITNQIGDITNANYNSSQMNALSLLQVLQEMLYPASAIPSFVAPAINMSIPAITGDYIERGSTSTINISASLNSGDGPGGEPFAISNGSTVYKKDGSGFTNNTSVLFTGNSVEFEANIPYVANPSEVYTAPDGNVYNASEYTGYVPGTATLPKKTYTIVDPIYYGCITTGSSGSSFPTCPTDSELIFGTTKLIGVPGNLSFDVASYDGSGTVDNKKYIVVYYPATYNLSDITYKQLSEQSMKVNFRTNTIKHLRPDGSEADYIVMYDANAYNSNEVVTYTARF